MSRLDFWILIPLILLILLGSVVLLSIAPFVYPQHLFYVAAALLIFFIFSKVDMDILRGFSPFLYMAFLLLLVLTLIFAEQVRGATRWLSLGRFAFQPSELVKPITVLFMAHMTSSNLGNKKFLYAAVFSLPVFLLVFVQPDLGSMVVLALGVLGVFLGSGLHFLWVVGGGIAAFVLSPLVWHFLADYQKQRIITFFSPQDDPLGAGYNVLQAMIAVGSGGLWGRGLGQGTQSQLAFLPERHTDFIFSALSEELGLAGGLLVIFAFSVLFARIIILLKKKEDLFSQSFLTGIFFILFIQVVINIGMNLGVLPVAGVPLPLVSSGGSSLLTTAASLGMVSSLSSDLKRPQF